MSDSRNKARPTLYMNPPLEAVKSRLREGVSFSRRLGEICERYALICQQPPDLSERERVILGNTLSGSFIEPLMIKHLDSEIEDSDAGDPSELRDLAGKVRSMSYADRVALLEQIGY